jgi:hypothetical protein
MPTATNRKELFQDFAYFAKLSYGVIINLKCNQDEYNSRTISNQRNSNQKNTYLINGELKKWEGENH